LKWRRLPLMRANRDPGNLALAVNDKQRAPCEIECIDSERLINAIGARYRSCFVKENREGIRVFVDVLLASE